MGAETHLSPPAISGSQRITKEKCDIFAPNCLLKKFQSKSWERFIPQHNRQVDSQLSAANTWAFFLHPDSCCCGLCRAPRGGAETPMWVHLNGAWGAEPLSARQTPTGWVPKRKTGCLGKDFTIFLSISFSPKDDTSPFCQVPDFLKCLLPPLALLCFHPDPKCKASCVLLPSQQACARPGLAFTRLPPNPILHTYPFFQKANKSQTEQQQSRKRERLVTALGKEPPEFGPEIVNSKGLP